MVGRESGNNGSIIQRAAVVCHKRGRFGGKWVLDV